VKIIEKILGIVLKIIVIVIGIVVEFTEQIKGVLKFMFETILFILLLTTCPVWLLPYMLIIKHREKKNESRDKR
jgi:uncharacterized membrane protein YbjE (DUF340 family)